MSLSVLRVQEFTSSKAASLCSLLLSERTDAVQKSTSVELPGTAAQVDCTN